MNREIEFRGKAIDTGEWVFGSLVVHRAPLQCFATEDNKSEFLISYSGFADWNMPRPVITEKVHPESIGQFICLKDKNKKKIYEGDIINYAVKEKLCPDCAKGEIGSKLEYLTSRFCPECGKESKEVDFITTAEIVFANGSFQYESDRTEEYYTSWKIPVAENYIVWNEVIGNVFDNPELLKKQ